MSGSDEGSSKKAVDRKLLARVFGDVYPETTSDEREPDETSSSSDDDWLRRQVPPHHG